jgi:hypothetical protein
MYLSGPENSFLVKIGLLPSETQPYVTIHTLNLWLVLIPCTFNIINNIISVISIVQKQQKERSNFLHFVEAFESFFPMIIFFPGICYYSFEAPPNICYHPIILAIMYCTIFADMVVHIMVAHLCDRRIHIFRQYVRN